MTYTLSNTSCLAASNSEGPYSKTINCIPEDMKMCVSCFVFYINSLVLGDMHGFKNAIFNLVLLIGVFRSSYDDALTRMSQDLTNDKSTLVEVMACCHITWANVDPYLCRYMASFFFLGHGELTVPGNTGSGLKNVIFNLVLLVVVLRSAHDNIPTWMSKDLTDDKSTLVQVMACFHQVTSHYLSQGWPISLLPYGINRPHCVNSFWEYMWPVCQYFCCFYWQWCPNDSE